MSEAAKKQEMIITKVTESIKNIVGIEAIVLGGSHVNKTSSPSSNIDIGLYYFADGVLDINTLDNMMTELDDGKRQGILALPGAWGEWLNGGSCIVMDGMIVDISLRNITKVNELIDNSNNKGSISVSYQFGHPFGFVSSMYMAEVDLCRILFEKKNVISNLKRKVRPLSIIYKKSVIEYFLWEASYSAQTARRCIDKKDIIYAIGALYKCTNSLVQVVFTINDEYVLNEKGSFNKINTFKHVPKDFNKNMQALFLSIDLTNMENAFQIIEFYINELRNMISTLSIY